MSEKTYTIKDVADILDTEAYVLRYYEKELHLKIKRNSQGHRMYRLRDIENFKKIKDLREQGLQLKAIEGVIHEIDDIEDTSIGSIIDLTGIQAQRGLPKKIEKEEVDIGDKEDHKVKQFSVLMKEMLKQALVEYDHQTKEQMKEELSEEMNTMVNKKFIELEVTQKEKDEVYYRKIDETMREMQKLRQSVSALEQVETKDKVSVWKKLFNGKNKNLDNIKVDEKDL
jgi:DNA-binding transcriptional MerR regulator